MNDFVEDKEQKAGAFSLREFLFTYIKYLPWLILSTVFFMVLAFIKLRYSTEIYQVSSKLLIKNEDTYNNNEDKLTDLFMLKESQNLNDEIEILKSTGLSKRIVTSLGLQKSYYTKGKVKTSIIHPLDSPFELDILQLHDSSQGVTMALTFVDDSTFSLNNTTEQVRFGQIIKNGYGTMRFIRRPVGYSQFSSNDFIATWQPLNDVSVNIAATFKINPINDFSNVLMISYDTENPKLGKDIVNKLMEIYNISNVEDKRRTTQYTMEFIDERLDTIRRELGGVEYNLQRFRETNKAIDLEQQSIITFGQISQNDETLTNQEVQLKVISFLESYLSDQRNSNKTVPTQLGITEPSLQAQILQYNSIQLERESRLLTMPEGNPMMQKLNSQRDELRQQISENLKNIRQAYIINRNNLLQKTRGSQSEISSVPGKAKRLLEITRQQKILEELYSFLLQKRLETSISSASTISNSQVIEPARTAPTPVLPNRKGAYTLALFFGLAIPAAIIFVKELLNDKISARSDVEKFTAAPILGEIGHSDETETLVVTRNSRKFIAEQFRMIRTNLQYVINKVERPVILITSSLSGEGKSFISTNIGAVMALAGKKTVIIEFDIRKPKIIAGLDMQRKSGITNFVVGNAQLEDIIIPISKVENLYVIPCGPIPPNPAEMILDEKVRELFQYLRKEFEVVIVDSAPVGLVSDAVILSTHADATLYIMRQNYTLKKQLDLINNLYENKKLPRLSLLLNDVKLGNGYGNYYGYGYGYGGNSDYFADDKAKRNGSIFKRIKSYFTW